MTTVSASMATGLTSALLKIAMAVVFLMFGGASSIIRLQFCISRSISLPGSGSTAASGVATASGLTAASGVVTGSGSLATSGVGAGSGSFAVTGSALAGGGAGLTGWGWGVGGEGGHSAPAA